MEDFEYDMENVDDWEDHTDSDLDETEHISSSLEPDQDEQTSTYSTELSSEQLTG